MLAFINSTGMLQPFAEYRAGAWTDDGAKAWDDPEPRPEPWFLKRGAPPAKWRVLVGPNDLRTVTTTRPEVVDGGCVKMWALSSDVAGQSWLRTDSQTAFTRQRLAASGDLGVSDFVPVAKEATNARAALLDTITPTFENAESLELARHPARGFPSAEVRRAIPPTIEAAFRTSVTVGGRVLHHVQAVRNYRRPPGSALQGCDYVTFFRAWISEEPAAGGRSRMTVVSSVLVLDECERAGARTIVPLSLVIVDGRSFVATAEYGYEDLTVGVYETDGQSLNRVLLTFGGGC